MINICTDKEKSHNRKTHKDEKLDGLRQVKEYFQYLQEEVLV